MEKAVFEKLQAHVFDEGNPWKDIWKEKKDKEERQNRLPYFSAWAIYGKDELKHKENIKDIGDDVIGQLKNNIVFVGLNFSKPLPGSWGYWQNIYNNFNVKWLLGGEKFNVEKYKGAYITDIIKNIIGPIAKDVMDNLKVENINKNIGWFFEEIGLLGSDNIEMYLFGNSVKELFEKHVIKHDGFKKFKEKVKKCQHINHYSGSNTGRFRKHTPGDLELIVLSLQDKKILW